MKKNYEPKGIEKKIYDKWESSGYFTAIPDEKKEPFCIMIPPPNVTGTLHTVSYTHLTLPTIYSV